MATKKLARELGLIRKSSCPKNIQINKDGGCRNRQFFPYLIVIDFESTCWRERKNYVQEIIEFPAVLVNTSNGKIESEFHTFVQPQEHPVLSEFCTELTGIRQTQVEAGVPLQICMSLFTRWLQTLKQEKNIEFVKDNTHVSTLNPCAFVTWSDWDLGVCLLYECKRKQIFKPKYLNRWIDLRATYKLFYNRKPKGLNGALQDLGIVFSGREHSGLDDARNTARLAWRMISDGCLMKITRNLDRAQLKTKLFLQGPPKSLNVGNGDEKTNHEPVYTKSTHKLPNSDQKENEISDVNQNTAVCQSLVMPRTLLSRLATPVVPVQIAKRELPAHHPVSRSGLSVSLPSQVNNRLVLVSTTVNCITDGPQLDTVTEPSALLSEWEGLQLLTEDEESCSYDDVILEDENADSGTSESDYVDSEDLRVDLSIEDSKHSKKIIFKTSNTTLYSVEKQTSHRSTSSDFKMPLSSCKIRTDKSISYPTTSFSSNSKAVCRPETLKKSSGFTMTTPKSVFSIYKDDLQVPGDSRLSSGSSFCASTSDSSSFTNGTSLFSVKTVLKGKRKITSPLCGCGRRAKRLTVANGGPNQGRIFYSCSIGKNSSGRKKRCGFFKWESAVLKSISASSSPSFEKPSSSLKNCTTSSPLLKKFASRSLRH